MLGGLTGSWLPPGLCSPWGQEEPGWLNLAVSTPKQNGIPGAKKHTTPAKCSSPQLTLAAPGQVSQLLLSELDVTFCLTQLLSLPPLPVCRLRATTAQALLVVQVGPHGNQCDLAQVHGSKPAEHPFGPVVANHIIFSFLTPRSVVWKRGVPGSCSAKCEIGRLSPQELTVGVSGCNTAAQHWLLNGL